MTVQRIELQLEAGENTCAKEPGVFCQFLETQRLGTIFYCRIFSGGSKKPFELYHQRYDELKDIDGWLQRHPACLTAAKKEV